jgi:hypothetical protein
MLNEPKPAHETFSGVIEEGGEHALGFLLADACAISDGLDEFCFSCHGSSPVTATLRRCGSQEHQTVRGMWGILATKPNKFASSVTAATLRPSI